MEEFINSHQEFFDTPVSTRVYLKRGETSITFRKPSSKITLICGKFDIESLRGIAISDMTIIPFYDYNAFEAIELFPQLVVRNTIRTKITFSGHIGCEQFLCGDLVREDNSAISEVFISGDNPNIDKYYKKYKLEWDLLNIIHRGNHLTPMPDIKVIRHILPAVFASE
jgi:hypothetical protein